MLFCIQNPLAHQEYLGKIISNKQTVVDEAQKAITEAKDALKKHKARTLSRARRGGGHSNIFLRQEMNMRQQSGDAEPEEANNTGWNSEAGEEDDTGGVSEYEGGDAGGGVDEEEEEEEEN